MKIYEKPMAKVNMFEVEDIIATSGEDVGTLQDASEVNSYLGLDSSNTTQGVVFQW